MFLNVNLIFIRLSRDTSSANANDSYESINYNLSPAGLRGLAVASDHVQRKDDMVSNSLPLYILTIYM